MFEKLHLRNFQTQGIRCVRKRLLLKYSNYSLKCGNIQRWILNIHYLLCERMTRRKHSSGIMTLHCHVINSPSFQDSWQRWFIRWTSNTHNLVTLNMTNCLTRWTRLIFFCFCPRVNIKSLKGNTYICASYSKVSIFFDLAS